MIDWVHHHAAHMRPTASPASPSRFAARHVHMIDITDLTNRRETVLVDPANFARRHFHKCISGFQRSERGLLPSTARDLAAATGSQFNIVDTRAWGNGTKRQRVSQISRNIDAGNNGRSNLKTIWRENVT